MGEVSLIDVAKHFTVRSDGAVQTVRALKRVSFTVHDGEVVALIGPSGCGKTTALRIAMGLETATSGHVTVDGRVVTGCGYDRGMVFQQAEFLPWLAALQVLELHSPRESAYRVGDILTAEGGTFTVPAKFIVTFSQGGAIFASQHFQGICRVLPSNSCPVSGELGTGGEVACTTLASDLPQYQVTGIGSRVFDRCRRRRNRPLKSKQQHDHWQLYRGTNRCGLDHGRKRIRLDARPALVWTSSWPALAVAVGSKIAHRATILRERSDTRQCRQRVQHRRPSNIDLGRRSGELRCPDYRECMML